MKSAAAAGGISCSNGRFVPNFNPNRPKRRRMATSKDGNWVVFVDQRFDPKSDHKDDYDDNPDKCFLWNQRLQLKVQLPCLEMTVERYFKCIVVNCGLSQSDNERWCHYKVCFFQKCWPGYDWTSDEMDFWEEERYSEDEDEFFIDAYISESSARGDGDDDDDIASHVFGVTPLGLFYGQNLRIQLPSRSVLCIHRRIVFQCNEEGNRLFLVERRPLCTWEVWEMDFAHQCWVSVSNLDGMVIFINDHHSTVYSCKLEAGRLEGNCLCFIGESDKDNLYLYSLADKTLAIFENKPHSGFPVWFPSVNNPGMPWLSFVEDNLEKITTSEDPGETANEPSCIDESLALANVFLKLPGDLQSFVAESLHSPLDYANFRLVCKLWSELARPIRWLPNLSSSGSIEFPWLICQESEACSSIIDPTCNMKYYKSNEELSGCKIRYSKDGWLLVTRGTREVFFIEPFTKTKINLPYYPEDFDPDAMSFSSSPTSSHWVIISIVHLMSNYRLMYLRPVDDEWSIIDCELESGFQSSGCSLVFHDHKFYYLNRAGNFATFWWEEDVLKYSVSTISQSTNGEEVAFKKFLRGYLVSCEESLYLVVVGLMGRSVEVFRWDVVASKWNRIETLGNYSFFICQTSTLALPISEKSKQSTISFPFFVEGRHLSYKLDASEFRYSNVDISTCSRSLYERKEFLNATWFQPKLIRGYR